MKNYLEYKGYIGTVDFNAEDGVFYDKVYGINDLVAFDGESVKELKKAFKEAVDDYLITCEGLSKEPDKTYKGTFNVRVTGELHRKAAIIAARKSITLNEFVKKALSYAVSHESNLDNQLIRG